MNTWGLKCCTSTDIRKANTISIQLSLWRLSFFLCRLFHFWAACEGEYCGDDLVGHETQRYPLKPVQWSLIEDFSNDLNTHCGEDLVGCETQTSSGDNLRRCGLLHACWHQIESKKYWLNFRFEILTFPLYNVPFLSNLCGGVLWRGFSRLWDPKVATEAAVEGI